MTNPAPSRIPHVYRLPAPVPVDGVPELVTVAHPLATMDVEVYCLDAAGDRLGFMFATAIDVDAVDVMAPPGCASILIRTAP